MIERLGDMPEGTIGFEFGGDVTVAEYREVLEPPLEEAVEVRLLLQTGADFDGMKLGARIEDAKANFRLGWRTARRGSGSRSSPTPTGCAGRSASGRTSSRSRPQRSR